MSLQNIGVGRLSVGAVGHGLEALAGQVDHVIARGTLPVPAAGDAVDEWVPLSIVDPKFEKCVATVKVCVRDQV